MTAAPPADPLETASPGDSPGGLDLGDVQQTLLVPLWCRAAETRSRYSILRDPAAVEIADRLRQTHGDAFAHFNRRALQSRVGLALRTIQFDDWARGFLARHPGGTVAEVGVGLNTRMERVAPDGPSHWLELDLPDVMAVRKRFFAPSDRRTMLAGSVLEPDWVDRLLDLPPPYHVSIEGVLTYLPEADVRRLFDVLGERLAGAGLAFDALTPRGVAAQHRHDTLKHFDARFDWGVEDVRTVADWRPGLACEEAITLKEVAVRNVDRMPWLLKLVGLGMATFKRRSVRNYWLARFTLG